MSFLIPTVSMLVILGIMVLVHEFGHFAVAKLCGVRVEIFSIGFGKRLFGFRRGDTDYRLSLLPLGGYVKMAGEMGGDGAPLNAGNGGTAQEALLQNLVPGEKNASEAAPTYDPAGDLNNHPRWQRVLIAVAGPVANFILAMVLMTGLFLMHMEVPDYQYQSAPAVIDSVPPNSPAARAGIQTGDRITRFDGVDNPTWEQVRVSAALNMNRTVNVTLERAGHESDIKLPVEIKGNTDEFDLDKLGLLPIEQTTPLIVQDVNPGSPGALAGLQPGDELISIDGYQPHSLNTLITMLQSGAGKPIRVSVNRKGQMQTLNVTPTLGNPGDGSKKYMIGFRPEPPPYHVVRYPLNKAISEAASFNRKNSTLIVEVLRRMVTFRMSLKTVSGPIGIAQVTGRAVTAQSWPTVIQLMSVISLNLGIFNLVPIPLLDGGVITLLLIEAALRRDLNQKFKERIYQTAFVFLMLFAAFVMFNDISKFSFFSHIKP